MSAFLFSKEAFGAIALVLTFAAFVPYYVTIWKRQVRPHVFSWLIWAAGTLVVCFAQLSDGAGIGAWPIGVSAVLTLGVAVLSLWKSADRSVKPVDLVFLALAATALPLWFLTSTALSAVIVLTTVDLLGFGPSFRKAYLLPHEESAKFFIIAIARNAFILLALENVSWTTALFPAAVLVACVAYVGMIFVRRASQKRCAGNA